MKCVGVVNPSAKNEPSLMPNLAKELIRRTYNVALVEHITRSKGLPKKITDIPNDSSSFTGVNCFSDKTTFSFEYPMSLDNVLSLLNADFVLVNGFEGDKSYPRIVIMDDNTTESNCLSGLEIAGYGTVRTSGFPVTDNIAQLVDIIEEKSFKLPNLNCEACGLDSCYAFAKEIVKGKRQLNDCVSLNPKVTIEIDGVPLPMNPFISGILEKTIRALVSSFKGYKKGRMEIIID